MTEPSRIINQVLIFENPKNARELGLPLWQALHEVEALFRRVLGNHIAFRTRYVVDETQPRPPYLRSVSGTGQVLPVSRFSLAWERSAGQYRETIDAERLAWMIRPVLGSDPLGTVMFVVTDKEISPPPGLRYVLSALIPNGAVVSAAPVDPWRGGQMNSDRIATIKRRVRAICCGLMSRWAGMHFCENLRCFLCQPLKSVEDLDDMSMIGEEHQQEFPRLAGWGWGADNVPPEDFQEPTYHPTPRPHGRF